jgi:hypothetical protein
MLLATASMLINVQMALAVNIQIGSAVLPPQGTGQFEVAVDPQGDGVVGLLNDVRLPADGKVFVSERTFTAALAADITATATEIPLQEGQAAALPSFGTVSIDGETISYGSIVGDTLIVAARGEPPAAHGAGTAVVASTRVPDCTATAAVTDRNMDVVFSFLPSDCTPGTDCVGIRAILLSLDNFEEITSATVVYRCSLRTMVEQGTFTLECPEVGDACTESDDCENGETCNSAQGVCIPAQPFKPAQASDSPLVDGQLGNLPTTCTGSPIIEPPACLGDCNDDGRVTPGELLIGLDIQLNDLDLSYCTAMDGNNSGTVTPGELLTALDHQLATCP